MDYQEKVKKLFSLARNNNNEHEREAALEKALELCAKHKIEVKEGREAESRDVIKKSFQYPGKRMTREKEMLAIIVAEQFRVEIVWTVSPSIILYTLIGEIGDIEAANQTIEYAWWHVAEKFKAYFDLEFREEQKRKRKKRAFRNGIRNDFVTGYMSGLRKRLMEVTEKYSVVLYKSDALMQKQRSVLEEMGVKERQITIRVNNNNSAQRAGYVFGQEMPGRTGVIGGKYE